MGVHHINAAPAAPRKLVLALVMAGVLGGFAATASADPISTPQANEELLKTLRAKGILSEDEYERIIGKMRSELKAQALQEAKAADDAAKAAEEKKKSEGNVLVGTYKDGFGFETADKKSSIALKVRVQADYRSFNNDSGSVAAPSANSANTFDIRRAYIGFAGKIMNDWTYEAVADVAQGAAPQLDTAWVNYGFSGFPWVQARIGQFTMPFSLEEITSDTNVDFQERSLADFLVPSKERGLMVYGTSAPALPGVYYAIAASNGQGKNTNEPSAARDGKDFIGRIAVNFAEVFGVKDAIAHVGFGYTDGTLPLGGTITGPLNNNANVARTEGRGLNFFTLVLPTAQGANAFQSMDRTRTGIEGLLAYGPVKLQTEWNTLTLKGTSAAGVGYERDINAHYVNLMWLVTGEKYSSFYKGGAFGAIKPDHPFSTSGGGWGALEVGVRYSKLDATDYQPVPTNPAGTGTYVSCTTALVTAGTNCFTNEADAWTFGVKWVPNSNTLLELNYVHTNFDQPVGIVLVNNANGTTNSESAITMRAGLSF